MVQSTCSLSVLTTFFYHKSKLQAARTSLTLPCSLIISFLICFSFRSPFSVSHTWVGNKMPSLRSHRLPKITAATARNPVNPHFMAASPSLLTLLTRYRSRDKMLLTSLTVSLDICEKQISQLTFKMLPAFWNTPDYTSMCSRKKSDSLKTVVSSPRSHRKPLMRAVIMTITITVLPVLCDHASRSTPHNFRTFFPFHPWVAVRFLHK